MSVTFSKVFTVTKAVIANWDLIATAIDNSDEFTAALKRFDWTNEQQTRLAMVEIIELPVLSKAVLKTSSEFDDNLLAKVRVFLANEELIHLAWEVGHSNMTALDLTKILAGGAWKRIIDSLPFAAAEEEQEDPQIGIITVLGLVSLTVHVLRYLKERKEKNNA